MLTLKDFIYDLPEELIAQEPLAHRESSRLLCYRDEQILDLQFKNIDQVLEPDSVLIVNDTRVIPSRLFGQTPTGGKAEVLLLEPSEEGEDNVWRALGRPTRKFNSGYTIQFAGGCEGTIVSEPDREADQAAPFLISFNMDKTSFGRWLEDNGYIPLPPYIARKEPKRAKDSQDKETYQTVYAKHEGSAAAPTAGLHFTPDVFQKLAKRGIIIAPVTLHVGAGTFLPVKTDDLSQHVMHEERYSISEETLGKIRKAMEDKKTIYAVGTTSLRCLESFHRHFPSWEEKQKAAGSWLRTRLFIRPETKEDHYQTWCVNGLITNFHQPGSTLFMLVAALVGLDSAKKIYRHAVAAKYRFFSYGDACFLQLKRK